MSVPVLTPGRHARQHARRHLTLVATVLALLVSVLAAATPESWAKFNAAITNSGDTVAVAAANTCAWAYASTSPAPYFTYPLSENPVSSSVLAADTSGNKRNATYTGTPAHSTSNGCARDLGGSTTFNGTNTLLVSPTAQASPQIFSIEIWFKTTVAGGYLIGLNNTKTGAGSSYDRHLYINATGNLVFGTYSGNTDVVTSTTTVNNGAWHHAVGTFTNAGGSYLYLDGKSVGTPLTSPSTAETNTGYWRIGYGNLASWPGSPTNYYFTGQLAYAAVYMSVLSPTTVAAHYSAGV